ncbi:MAG: DUF2125 domain-containing protein [Rhodospirillaceae bacterium]|nr:DUF2125 domain-containing protein [Rhodospirillaceae bacterium]
MSPTRRIFRLVMAATALAAIGVGWFFYWQLATDRFQIALDDWAARERALGRTVEYAPPVFSGFPFAIRAEIADPVYAMPAAGWRWQGPTIQASASPFDPLTIELDAPGAHAIAGPNGDSWTVDADSLTGTLDFSLRGLDAVALEGDNVRAVDAAGAATAFDSFAVRATPADEPPATYRDPLLGIDIRFDGLVLPLTGLPLGDRIEHFAFEGRVMGPVPPGNTIDALETWRDAGGTIEIDAIDGEWGTLGFSGDGTFALDPALQPEGAMSMTLSGHAATIDTLVAQGLIDPQQAALAKTVLSALERTPADGDAPEVTLPVTLQDRTLSVGPIKFARLDPIDWPSVIAPFGN